MTTTTEDFHSQQATRFERFGKALELLSDLPDNTPWSDAETVLVSRLQARDAIDGCPRCLRPLPQFAGDRGALSRVSEEHEIRVCGPCGTDEAAGYGVTPVSTWPIATIWDA